VLDIPSLANRSRARRELPGLGAELGLEYVPPVQDTDLGTLHGAVEGHEIKVTPNESTMVELALARPAGFGLVQAGGSFATSMPKLLGESPTKTDFDIEDELLDRYFQQRRRLPVHWHPVSRRTGVLIPSFFARDASSDGAGSNSRTGAARWRDV